MSAARHAASSLAADFQPEASGRIDPTWPGANVTELAQKIVDHPNFAALGAIGPDLFFFLPDFRDVGDVELSSVLVRILEFLEGVYQAVDPYITKYEKYLGPISEDSAEELSRLTGGLSESVDNITGELGDILMTALEDFVTQQSDWWSNFSLGLNKGFDEQAYLWSDMLHYRQSGEFGQALWRKAAEADDDAMQAYALGYLSHIATDTTAHALVNQVAGGPYRLHWQRHHLVENHADSYWYRLDDEEMAPRRTGGYDQLTKSALYFDIAFGDDDAPVPRPAFPAGNTLRDNWVRHRLLDVDSELPGSVADLLRETIEEVFYSEGRKHPNILRDEDGRASAKLIEEAYDLFFRYLKIATVDGFDHQPPPPPEVFPNLDFPTPSDPGGDDPPGDDDGGDFWDDVLDFILAVIAAIAYVIEVAVYLATLPWAVLADLVTYPLRLGLYFALELPLFYILKAFRSVLVRTAYLHPMSDEIDQSLIRVGNPRRQTWAQVLDEVGDVFGALLERPPGEPPDELFRDPMYPYVHCDGEFRHPWDYPGPDTPTERCPTTAGPHATNSGPPIFFRRTRPDTGIRDRLETAASPTEADRVGCDVSPSQHLGDAVTMTAYTIWLATRAAGAGDDTDASHLLPRPARLTDWNLDSDRGYGYHCWDWNRRPESEEFPRAKDPERLEFLQPCTWPQQADRWDPHDPCSGPPPAGKQVFNPAVALQLHWAGPGLEDPGCQEPECVDCTQPPPIG